MEEPKSTAKRRAKTAASAQEDKITLLPLSELHDFPNHPFKVRDDEAMQETTESIRQYGVLVPAIVRPREDGGYEIIAGHRRRRGSELAGLSAMPCIVRRMDDDTATILMVDSNIQRENILPSERAQAYKMKLEAIRRKAGRPAKGAENLPEDMETLRLLLGCRKERDTPEFFAALYLLTSNKELADRTFNCFFRGGIDFRYARRRGISSHDYTLLMAAKSLCCHTAEVTQGDLAEPQIIPDEAFRLLINALLIARFGLDALKITARRGQREYTLRRLIRREAGGNAPSAGLLFPSEGR